MKQTPVTSRIAVPGNNVFPAADPCGMTRFRTAFLPALIMVLSLILPHAVLAEDQPKAAPERQTDEIEIEGRIFTRFGPLPEAVAALYKEFKDIPDKPFLIAPPADAWGVFHVSVPPGRYFFTAYGKHEGKDYQAFHGNNPMPVMRHHMRLGLMAMPVKEAVRSEGTGLLKGIATFKGKPLPKGYVSVYAPDSENFKGLGLKSESLDENGKFSMKLPPGEYVVTAKMTSNKGSESGFGPPKHGDLIGFFLNNPVKITDDEDVTIEVQTFPKGDRPSFDEVTNVEYLKTQFTSAFEIDTLATAGIKGRITDVDGKPIKDIFVLAYKTNEQVFQMFHLSHGTPNITWTDDNGEYFIPLEETGNYYVVARDTLGNAPHRDEIYGLYQGHPMHRVAFESGTILEKIDIVAGVTMDPSEKYANKQTEAIVCENKEIGDLAINQDTIWSGEITVNGVVSVQRGVTLTVKPGTTVKFKKLDRDNNRIGDGELMIEGRIIAEGTPDKRITFTSAEKNPAKLDWSYVNVISTGADNIFKYCVFEYGFSGMQIHYSNVKVHDCLFWKSGEGLHFNTANLEVLHNTMTGNGVGLKFSRLEGDILVSKNLIHDNEIGVQFTHQHINAVDFDNLHKFLEHPRFVSNNFMENTKYNFSMGELQSISIDVKDNWWGTADPEQIEPMIFDKIDDEELGEVTFAPPLAAPVAAAGVRDGSDK